MDAHVVAYLVAALFGFYCVARVVIDFAGFVIKGDHTKIEEHDKAIANHEGRIRALERQP